MAENDNEMEENKHSENNSSENLTNKGGTIIQKSSFTKSQQNLGNDQNKNLDEIKMATGQDTVLRRYHKLLQKKSEHDQKRLKDNVLTVIVIVNTILILLLGFLVYRDISKRLNNLENRMSNIEASITKKANITIDDIEIYDAQ